MTFKREIAIVGHIFIYALRWHEWITLTLCSFVKQLEINTELPGLEITASQQTMSGQSGVYLTRQILGFQGMLPGHFVLESLMKDKYYSSSGLASEQKYVWPDNVTGACLLVISSLIMFDNQGKIAVWISVFFPIVCLSWC